MNALFLTTWYPNRYDAMDGLFVRKHAQAAARCGVGVSVLVVKDAPVSSLEREVAQVGGVCETVWYQPQSAPSWQKLVWMARIWMSWKRENAMPDVVHLNVITKMGFLAQYLRIFYKIPYVISEHFSIYLRENRDRISFATLRMMRFVAGGASVLMPVSQVLGSAMEEAGVRHRNCVVVPNVVDDFFFRHPDAGSLFPRPAWVGRQAVHVSCFQNDAKNVLGVISAVSEAARLDSGFRMVMVGNGRDFQECRDLAYEYGLVSSRDTAGDTDRVLFVGEQTPEQVKLWMDSSDVFVLFSHYETAAVVVAEAAACGLPIISTPVGIAPLLADEVVPDNDVEALAGAMLGVDVARRPSKVSAASKYMFAAVGRQFVDIYSEATH